MIGIGIIILDIFAPSSAGTLLSQMKNEEFPRTFVSMDIKITKHQTHFKTIIST